MRPGGQSATGRPISSNIRPETIDQITPIYVGGKKEIGLIEKFMAEGL